MDTISPIAESRVEKTAPRRITGVLARVQPALVEVAGAQATAFIDQLNTAKFSMAGR